MNAANPLQRLPGVLGEIADAAGHEAALIIAHARGGTEIYVPPQPAADHWLSKLVGHDTARVIADHLTCGVGGLRVVLPLGPAGHLAKTRERVDAMLAEDRSERDIALATGYTIRSVRRRRARMGKRGDSRQLSLL